VEFVNGRREVIGRHNWRVEDFEFVERSQIPLRLAYAVTIHKAQGCSLDCALVDIGSGNFEFGQAYVALSRVRSLDALYIYDFETRVFRAHSRVKAFYAGLRTLDVENLLELAHLEKKVETVETAETAETAETKVVEQIDEKEETKNNEKGIVQPGSNWLYDSLPATWKDHMIECQDALARISGALDQTLFLPRRDHIWAALERTPLDTVRVVILGQDPYPTPGHACGLSFSVGRGVRSLPPSLINIYKELVADLGGQRPDYGDLGHWADQGILLLNSSLTVEPGKPQSHSHLKWDTVTDHILRKVAEQDRPVFFVLWGKSAQAKKKVIETARFGRTPHRIHESAHPSPLSAHRGFFGSRPFSAVNQWLQEQGLPVISWVSTSND
jgi:uracil-DNA glycosylase